MGFTVVILLKRRAGLSRSDFMAYYETTHRPNVERVLTDFAVRYERYFLEPIDGATMDHDFDLIVEVDFPDQDSAEGCFSAMGDSGLLDEIIVGEEQLYDRSKMRIYVAKKRGSNMPLARTPPASQVPSRPQAKLDS